MLVLTTGYLLASIPLYGLIGLLRSPTAAEAAMKTYLMGALLGIVLLLGVSILYGVTAATRYADLASRLGDAPAAAVAAGLVGVVAGLMFEAGGVPAHFWVPDAAEGANGTAAIFLTTVPKIGALIALYRMATVLPDTASLLIAIFAVASMTLGNLAAYLAAGPTTTFGLVDRQPSRLPAGTDHRRRPQRPCPSVVAVLPRRLHPYQQRGVRGQHRATQST